MTAPPDAGLSLLSLAEMYRADRLAMEAGVAGVELMERAGGAVADAVLAREQRGPVLVLCGPGNNGGDGFVAARLLAAAGWPVTLALLGTREKLKGDAAHHADLWDGDAEPLEAVSLEGVEVVIDALFGAGLQRPLEGAALDVVRRLNASGLPVYAVDVPSGLGGDSGDILGDTAVQAKVTITFFRLKTGHLLLPGRSLCGEIVVADIGIPDAVLSEIEPRCHRNAPELWRVLIPRREAESHKYHFGHALISVGQEVAGAGILAGRAALRVGAGLVSLATAPDVWGPCVGALPTAICRRVRGEADFEALLRDRRLNAVLIGPGAGIGETTRRRVTAAAGEGRHLVLDADALTSFADRPDDLFALAAERKILTPHEGEFARVFPDLSGDKLSRAREAAARASAVVLLKGADTVIAAPSGQAVICDNAPPWLATAGAGDVLSGLILGLLAQGMPCFEAAAAGAWIHGAAASRFGPGMIAEDLPAALPRVLGAEDMIAT
jgi:NAD(P)H-hydrate epimerase